MPEARIPLPPNRSELARRATKAHAALRESEARYRDLVEHAPIAIYEEDFTSVVAWMDELRAPASPIFVTT